MIRLQICLGSAQSISCSVGADHSPPLEGWSMHFVMYTFSNHVGVLHNVTPIDLLAQSAVLSDGVVASWGC